ncbi:nuclear receptor co-repressor 2 [Sarotherodon galilaeus]
MLPHYFVILKVKTTETAVSAFLSYSFSRGVHALGPHPSEEQTPEPHYGKGFWGLSSFSWQRRTIAAFLQTISLCKPDIFGGPGHGRSRPLTTKTVLSDEDVRAAIALLRHSADEDICERIYPFIGIQCLQCHSLHLSMFCIFALQIEQNFRLLFCEVTACKFLERWPISLKAKVVKESHGLVSTSELLELMCNAESGTEVDNDCDCFYLPLLVI